MAVEMIGPFYGNQYKVSLDGYRVPFLIGYPTDASLSRWTLVLDERMGLDLGEEELHQVLAFVADALAVGAGYKSHSDACQHQGERHNPFGTRMLRIDRIEEDGNER